MARWQVILRVAVVYMVSFMFVYLVWVGAQHIVLHFVTMEITDIAVASALAVFITKEVIIIDDKLRIFEQLNARKAGR